MNKYSSRVTQPRSQGASQAMLYGIGLTDADLQKPQVGICSMWYEGNTCNMHLDRLAAHVKEGVQAAGLVGLRFNTVGVSDGLSMGTDGMSYSLPSRDLIADSIETVMGAQWYDALITVPGCDKNMPGSVIAMARLNRPSLMVYGGTIRAGFAQASRATSSRRSSPTESIWPARSPTSSGWTSSATRARARAPAVGCTPRTRWPSRSRRWDSHFHSARRFRPKTQAKATNAGARARRARSTSRSRWRRARGWWPKRGRSGVPPR